PPDQPRPQPRYTLRSVSVTVQIVRDPACSCTTSPGPSSSHAPVSTNSTVARPDTTTNSSSASTSLIAPGVISQTPTSSPSNVPRVREPVAGDPVTTWSAGTGSWSRSSSIAPMRPTLS